MKKLNDSPHKSLLLRRSDLTPTGVFSFACILSLVVLLACFVATRGELIGHYFYYDQRDTGMDFFHSLEYVRGRVPYERFETLYPPLANLFFLCLYFIVPVNVSQNWTPDFWGSILLRGTHLDLRTYQAPLLLFVLVLVISAWMLTALVVSMLKRFPYKQANSVALCILLSPGMMMAFERGNTLFFVVPMCLFFLQYRNSDNPVMRELALISLALAAGFKLYPAFFGILLLRDKKYGQAARAIVYGILSVILPTFAFKEGLAGIPLWLEKVFGFGGANETMPHIGTSFANILHRIALYSKDYLGLEIGTSWFSVAGMIVSGLLLLASLAFKKDWQSVLAGTLAIIMFSSNGEYIYAFMCIPAVMILKEEERFDRSNIIPYILIVSLCVHLPLFHTHMGSYPNIAIKQLLSLLIVLWCVYSAAVNCIKKFRK